MNSAHWTEIEKGEVPAYWNDGSVTHACEGSEVHRGVFLMWTKCRRDVPAGKAHVVMMDAYTYGADKVTCEKCRA